MKSVCVTPPPAELTTLAFEAFPTNSAARRDALGVTQTLEPSVTLDAVPSIKSFTRAVLLARGDTDKPFPVDHARRLEADFPNARLEIIAHASTYVMLDQPRVLATHILSSALSAD